MPDDQFNYVNPSPSVMPMHDREYLIYTISNPYGPETDPRQVGGMSHNAFIRYQFERIDSQVHYDIILEILETKIT